MKNNYFLIIMALCLFSSLEAQTLTALGVRIPGGNLNSVVGFNASTTTYTVNLSSTQTLIPTVEATAATGSTAVVTNATSTTGTLAQRTATVVVTTTVGGATRNYTVIFIKSINYIEGFTEEIAPSTYQADGTYNNGQQLGNRSCRTTTSSNSVYWTLPTLVNGAGKISLYISRDYGNSNLLSTLQIKKSADGGTNWSTVASINASTYAFSAVGTWQKVEYDLNINSATTKVQINIVKTGTTRDFMIDDIVITPYSTTETANAATNVTGTEFTANWSSLSWANQYILSVYSKTSDVTPLPITGSPFTISGATNKVLTGLDKNTVYYYTVTASDGVNSTSPSNEVYDKYATTVNGSGLWGDASQWLNGSKPVSGAFVLLRNNTNINEDVNVSSLNILPGIQLTLSAGKTLSTTNLLLESNTNGTATFLDNGGTLNSTTANVQQYLSSARNWYMSASVSGASSLPTVDTGSLLYYSYPENDGINQAANSGAYWNTVSSGIMAVNKGYIIRPSEASTITFTGTSLNTNDQTISDLSYTSANPKHGFNLIGNPYPSYVNVLPSITANSNLEATVWYRTRDTNQTPLYHFETVNATSGVGTNTSGTGRVTGYIPPMQAFWVRTTADNQSIVLLNANRSHAKSDVLMSGYPITPTTVLKAPSTKLSNYTLLGLNVSNGTTGDETIVMFTPEALNGLDAYDSGKLNNNNVAIPEIFTVIEGEHFAINGMNSIPYDTEIPLGFTTGQAGSNFRLKASEMSNFDPGTQIFIKDYAGVNNPVITDLGNGVAYTFSSEITSNNTTRFALIFKAPSVVNGLNNTTSNDQNVKVYRNMNNQITVDYAGTVIRDKSVVVYNAVGQKLINKQLTGNTTVLDNQLSSGVYFVTVDISGNKTIKKVIIN